MAARGSLPHLLGSRQVELLLRLEEELPPEKRARLCNLLSPAEVRALFCGDPNGVHLDALERAPHPFQEDQARLACRLESCAQNG